MHRFFPISPRFLVAFAALALVAAPTRAGDLQLWQWVTIDFFKNDRWRLYLYGDNRIGDDLSSAYLQIASPRVTWSAFDHLDLGLGYAWLNIDPLSGADDFWQHRAEFEFNPKIRSGPWSFHNRNRLELRWDDGRGRRRPRLRNRLQIMFNLDHGENPGLFTHLYANNEFFFDLSSGEYVENRLIPLGIGFRLSRSATLNLFVMMQSLNGPGGWTHDPVAGTFLQVAF